MKKTGQSRIQRLSESLKKLQFPPKLVFLITGIASTIWFLVRVIPKPSRATYPCMKVAAPFMSSLVIYLIGITGSAMFYKRTLGAIKTNRYKALLISLPVFIVFFTLSLFNTPTINNASTLSITATEANLPSAPVGDAKGINPGRVVWTYNFNAVNHNMSNSDDDYWYMDKNVDANEIELLLTTGLQYLTGESTESASWNALFEHFNEQHGNGTVGYTTGEKIFIKTNFTNSCCGQIHRMDATPQLMLALLKSLIEEAGVDASSIYIGDPFRDYKDFHLNPCYNVYPDVHYIGPNAVSPVEQTIATTNDILVFSDGQETAHIPQINVDAAYFINMPCLKSHDVGGITINAKNHQGSILEPGSNVNSQSAFYMHYALPGENQGSGKYRHLVDYMAHEHLGGKTLLYLVDGIWGGDNWEGNIFKWQMDPFNNKYPSSVLVSQDPVAIDAVCYDILLEEYTNPPNGENYPYIDGTNDYLWQAASETYWPAGITYDPEGDGSKIGSLGVYEHWNNATSRKYSRNLGTGNGIELIEFNTEVYEYPEIITTSNSELPSDQVNVLYVDSSNTVWIGTNAGLSRMGSDGWKQYDTILLNTNVNDIAYERTAYGKELWVATDSGLTVTAYTDLDGVTGATTYVQESSDIVGNRVTAVMVDDYHNRWVGTDSAVNVFKGSTWAALFEGENSNREPFWFKDYLISDIEWYENDEFALVSTEGIGVARLSYDEIDGFTGASNFGKPWSNIASDTVYDADVSGINQWYGTYHGASKHESNGPKSGWSALNASDGLQADQVKAVYIDHEENTWLGTSNGISIVTDEGVIVRLSEADGLVNNIVNHISGDTAGNIWVATSGGIQWFTEVNGTPVSLETPELISPANNTNDVDRSSEKLIWSKVPGATSYSVEIATDMAFSSIIHSSETVDTSLSIQFLEANTTYYWRVSSLIGLASSDWSDVYMFTTVNSSSNSSIAEINSGVLLYPNPVSEILTIELIPEQSQNISVYIYSTDGKLIDSPITNRYIGTEGTEVTINVNQSKYSTGLYIVHVQGEYFNQVSRITIR